jgi:hypothetical protein
MKLIIITSLLISIVQTCVLGASTETNSQQFLDKARMMGRNRSWGAMSGTISHLRKNSKPVSAPLFMGILFARDRVLAQIIIDNKQGYYVGQSYLNPAEGTSVIPVNKNGYHQPLLPEFGIRPQDLAMAFIYWEFISELQCQTIKGAECRVFILKDYKSDEHVKVFFSSSYFFPLKVEWYKNKYHPDAETYRTLEVSSFKKENDFWLVSNLNLYGPGWRTKIEFTDTQAGYIEQGIPPALFKELPDEKS